MSMPRLLPWLSTEGKPCYLLSSSENGRITQFADAEELRQLTTGAEVLRKARDVLGDLMSPYDEVRYAAVRLAECLDDTLRIAESRGLRLERGNVDDAAT